MSTTSYADKLRASAIELRFQADTLSAAGAISSAAAVRSLADELEEQADRDDRTEDDNRAA